MIRGIRLYQIEINWQELCHEDNYNREVTKFGNLAPWLGTVPDELLLRPCQHKSHTNTTQTRAQIRSNLDVTFIEDCRLCASNGR